MVNGLESVTSGHLPKASMNHPWLRTSNWGVPRPTAVLLGVKMGGWTDGPAPSCTIVGSL